jgi:hypothetical protein
MSLAALRERAGTRWVVGLLAVVLWANMGDLAHAAWDDPACDSVPIHHDHAAHRVTAEARQVRPSDGHCYLCHAFRQLRVGLSARSFFASGLGAALLPRPGTYPSLSRLVGGATSSRAPPLSL